MNNISKPLLIVRESRLRHAVWSVIFFLVLVLFLSFSISKNFPKFIIISSSLVIFLILIVSLSLFKKSLRSDSWLMKIYLQGIEFNIHSYLSENEGVFFLAKEDMLQMKVIHETRLGIATSNSISFMSFLTIDSEKKRNDS